MKNLIAVVTGEPNSINSEIIAKTWKKLKESEKKRIFFIGNYELLLKQFKKIKIKIPVKKIDTFETQNIKGIKILDIPLKFKNCFNVKKEDSAKYVKKCLDKAHMLSIKNRIIGFVNCPIDKKIFRNKSGVTEYLAKKNNLNNSEVMLIYNKNFSVVPITTHIKIKHVSKNISSKIIKKKLNTINKFYKKKFKKIPKIGVLGMNPHNLELSKDSEERSIILPAINSLKNMNLKIYGPFPADTIFLNLKKYNFDVIVGMYHDQVLTPFKTIYGYDAINITLGLKYIRISPDHGIAKDLIAKNKASPKSLISALSFIRKLK